MPHCIIEYSHTLSSQISATDLIENVHAAASGSGLFEQSHIRTRAIAYEHFTSSSDKADFIHVRIHLHKGRTQQQRKALTLLVISELANLKIKNTCMTAETIEIDTKTYSKLLT